MLVAWLTGKHTYMGAKRLYPSWPPSWLERGRV
jgi:hypothetical protein